MRAGVPEKSAAVQGSKWYRIPKVRAEIDAAMERRSERVEVKQDDVLRTLLALMNADIGEAFDENGRLKPIHKIPAHVRKAIAGVESFEEFEGHGKERVAIGEVRKVKFWDKTRAIEMAMKHLGLLVDRSKVEHSFADMTDEQLEARFRALVSLGVVVAAPGVGG